MVNSGAHISNANDQPDQQKKSSLEMSEFFFVVFFRDVVSKN
jgi:hypothetical protein